MLKHKYSCIVKLSIKGGQKGEMIMDVWGWSSPIGLGLFLMMVAGMVFVLAFALAVAAKGIDILVKLPVVHETTRRRR
ncbi:MAG TPA: hypothetical protein VMR51_01355 [Patescibacteria group bacterium]|nr:hypothetical protein [Patescibacteria group bacterium]